MREDVLDWLNNTSLDRDAVLARLGPPSFETMESMTYMLGLFVYCSTLEVTFDEHDQVKEAIVYDD